MTDLLVFASFAFTLAGLMGCIGWIAERDRK